jgi:hypothetical protein
MSGIMNMLLGARTAIAVAVDEFFNLVTLLLPGDGTNGAQNNTFLDSSTNNFTITRNGNTTQGTFSPFSQTGWGNYFDGSGDYLSFASNAAFTVGTGDLTIEAWIYVTSLSQAYQGIISGRADVASNYPGLGLVIDNSQLFFTILNAGSGLRDSATVPLNQWVHVVGVRSGTNAALFVNGSRKASSTNSENGTSSAMAVGRYYPATDNYYFNGYISNARLVKGTAVYDPTQTSITVPTAPLTAITNTSLLTCQSNRFIDNSTNAFTLTVNGNPSVQAFSPFLPTIPYSAATVGGSGFFDGAGDYLTGSTPLSSSTSMSTFTVEGWIYPTTFANTIWVVGDMDATGTTNALAVRIGTNGDAVLYWFDGTSSLTCASTTFMRLNQWNWFAVVVNSNAISIYVNSTTPGQAGTTTLTNRTQTTNFSVGQYNNSTTPAAYISSLRWSNGIARTISSIPTAPYTSDANTRLLLNFTNAGITDATAKNDLETVGNAQISTAQSKFGGSSMYFDGTGDYVIARANTALAIGSGDFTVEGWVYSAVFPSSGNFQTIYTNGTTNTSAGAFSFGVDSTGKLYVYSNSAFRITTATNISLATWAHFAVVRSGTTVRIYINGTADANTWTSVTNNFSDGSLVVGVNPNTAAEFFNGYIDDLRVTKFARYTTNFTAPTAAFPLQ